MQAALETANMELGTLPHYPVNDGVMRKVPNLSFVESFDLHCGGCDHRQWRAGVSFPMAF